MTTSTLFRTTVLSGLLLSLAIAPAGCAVFSSIFGGAGGGDDYQAEFDKKDRKALEDACVIYVKKPHGNQGKKVACEQLALLNANEIADLAAAKDYPALKDICSRKTRRDTHEKGASFKGYSYNIERASIKLKTAIKTSPPYYWSSEKSACSAVSRGDKVNASERLAKLLTTCSGAEAMVEAYHKSGLRGQAEQAAMLTKIGAKLGECKDWDGYFEHAIRPTVKRFHLSTAMEKMGHNVEKEFVAYLNRHKSAPLAFKYAKYSAGYFLNWLMAQKRYGNCKAFVPHLPKMSDEVQAQFTAYLAHAKCAKAAKHIAQFLGHDQASYRVDACWALGKLRAKKFSRQVRNLAQTDPAYQVVDFHKNYYVRAACAKAANKIAL